MYSNVFTVIVSMLFICSQLLQIIFIYDNYFKYTQTPSSFDWMKFTVQFHTNLSHCKKSWWNAINEWAIVYDISGIAMGNGINFYLTHFFFCGWFECIYTLVRFFVLHFYLNSKIYPFRRFHLIPNLLCVHFFFLLEIVIKIHDDSITRGHTLFHDIFFLCSFSGINFHFSSLYPNNIFSVCVCSLVQCFSRSGPFCYIIFFFSCLKYKSNWR